MDGFPGFYRGPCASCVPSHLHCSGSSLFWLLVSLGLVGSGVLPATHVGTRPGTALISFCTVRLQTLCAAYSLAALYLSATSGPDLGELPNFWGSMVSHHAPIPKNGSGNQQQLALFSRPNLFLNLCTFPFVLSLSLLPHLLYTPLFVS